MHWRLVLVMIVLGGLILLLTAGQSPAHEWYEGGCCNNQDCRAIPFDHVVTTPDGFIVRPPGATEATLIPFDSPKIRITSPLDTLQQFHVCTRGGTPDGEVLCLYVPAGGA